MNKDHLLPCLVVLALEVLLGDLHIDQRHSNVGVAEDLFESGETHAGAEHSRGKGISELVRPNERAASSFSRILQCLMYPGVLNGPSVREQE